MWFRYGLKAQKLLAQGNTLGISAISLAHCKGKSLKFSYYENASCSETEGFPIGKCFFSYDSTMSDIKVSSMAFLSLAGVSSVTKGRRSSILLSANSYCSFVILSNLCKSILLISSSLFWSSTPEFQSSFRDSSIFFE